MQPFHDEQDNREVDSGEILWRRLVDEWIITNREDGTVKIISAAFIDRIDGNISVHIASLTSIEEVRRAYPHSRIAALEARVAQECGFTVVRDPQPDDPSHAILRPPPGRSKKTKISDGRHMAAGAHLVDLEQ